LSKLKILTKQELKSSISVVVGTRPGIIKFAPVVYALQKLRVPFFLIHTGQHYSYNMDRQFFEELGLPEPRYRNNRAALCRYHGEQTAAMITGVEQALLKERPQIIVVGGDANTNLSGALAGRKLGLQVAHMEAGLRSHDWRMPEEHNRVMIDHISEYLFPPTQRAKKNLLRERVQGRIWVTGNTIVDAVQKHAELSRSRGRAFDQLGLNDGDPYFLLTVHREENVDQKRSLTSIVASVERLVREFDVPVIFPIHPRTRNRVRLFGLSKTLAGIKLLRVVPAVGYLDFLSLLQGAQLVLTDSGGIQEEACCLKVPCVTLRGNTERPETVVVGANVIAGTEPSSVVRAARKILTRRRAWKNPFGDGQAGMRIAKTLAARLR
jgi:UDP-N-acetylglucosamine 2-epimerase (non-hydrolysing)